MEKKQERQAVEIGGFVVVKDYESSIITVSDRAGSWYLGYSVSATQPYGLLDGLLFAEEEPTDTQLEAAHIFIATLYVATHLADADYTQKLLKLGNDYFAEKAKAGMKEVSAEEEAEMLDEMKRATQAREMIAEMDAGKEGEDGRTE